MSKLPKVFYIMGTARSGSTILEILLSKGKGAFGPGELTSLIQDGFIENKECSCGELCADCVIWRKVQEHLKLDKQELEEWAVLQKKVDWHAGFIKQLFHLLPEKEMEWYRALNVRLLDAIHKAADCSVVLDSSKYAGRALALTRIVKADVKVICLTRSPAGLMASFQKSNRDEQRPKSTLAALLYYVVTLAALRLASLLLGRQQVYRLRYESLIADPQGVLQSIAQWIRIDLDEPRQILREHKSFNVGHLVTGNRLRKMGSVRFNPSRNGVVPGGFGTRLAVMLMNGWQWVLRF